MGIGEFFRALFGGQPPATAAQQRDAAASGYVGYQKQSAQGDLAASRRLVAVMTMTPEIRVYLDERLRPMVERTAFRYTDKTSVETATAAQVVIMEALPKTDALMHDKYDKILRLKKSMGKTQDTYYLIGHRQDFKKYPRGTYPNMHFFCVVEGDLDHREADLPLEGLPTVEGPRLYNFADMPKAIAAKLK